MGSVPNRSVAGPARRHLRRTLWESQTKRTIRRRLSLGVTRWPLSKIWFWRKMISWAHCADKCWKFTNAKPLAPQEYSGESIWLSLGSFLIGNLMLWIGIASRGIREMDGCNQTNKALLLCNYYRVFEGYYFIIHTTLPQWFQPEDWISLMADFIIFFGYSPQLSTFRDKTSPGAHILVLSIWTHARPSRHLQPYRYPYGCSTSHPFSCQDILMTRFYKD